MKKLVLIERGVCALHDTRAASLDFIPARRPATPALPGHITVSGIRVRACARTTATREPKPISRTASCLIELLAQFVLGSHQGPLARRRQLPTGAIDIEREHGKRRAKGIALAAAASFGRPFQGGGNPLGIARCEDALV